MSIRVLVVDNHPVVRSGLRGMIGDEPDIEVFMDDLVFKDETVEYHWTFTGTNTGPGGTGKYVRISGLEEWTTYFWQVRAVNGNGSTQADGGVWWWFVTTPYLFGDDFESGDLTVITLNLYEQAVLEAELQLIEAQADFFRAEAAYLAAMGIGPGPP